MAGIIHITTYWFQVPHFTSFYHLIRLGKILGDAVVASFPPSLRGRGPQITFRNSCAFGWAVAGGRAKVKKGLEKFVCVVGRRGR